MSNEKIYGMLFSKLYPMLIAKAERKGRTRAEVDEITCWLTGYTAGQLSELLESDIVDELAKGKSMEKILRK